MGNEIKDEIELTAAQCAKRTGLTVRALRLYEQAGLIRPRRTGKNWRLYGAREIVRLNEILALKRLGFSLQSIARLLAGQEPDLGHVLSMQNLALREQLSCTQQSLAIVDALRTKVAAGDILSIDELLKLAKDANMAETQSNSIVWRRYEQARPRVEQKIDPDLYPQYDGYYLLDGLAYTVTLRNGRLFSRLTGQPELEIFPEDIDRFFYKAVQAQITFSRDENGDVCALVLHQDGFERFAPRVEEDVAFDLEQALAERIREKRPMENSKILLDDMIAQSQRGEPDYERLTPPLAAAVREQSGVFKADLDRLGAVKDISFKGVTESGWDVYDVGFEKGRLEWSFTVNQDGKLSGIFIRPLV